jgi:hypothetical protein
MNFHFAIHRLENIYVPNCYKKETVNWTTVLIVAVQFSTDESRVVATNENAPY